MKAFIASRLPPSAPGMRIGLFGGSFNPPHDGHRLVAETALRRLHLHQIWWMISPGNPLKRQGDLKSLEQRVAMSRMLVRDPRIRVTTFEAEYNLRYTAETIAFVRRRRPGVHFVWIIGADNLAGFHKWQNWQTIVETIPIAVIDRPGATLAFLSAKMAKRFDLARVDEAHAADLALRKAPAWTFIHGPRSFHSSTQLRRQEEDGQAHWRISGKT